MFYLALYSKVFEKIEKVSLHTKNGLSFLDVYHEVPEFHLADPN